MKKEKEIKGTRQINKFCRDTRKWIKQFRKEVGLDNKEKK